MSSAADDSAGISDLFIRRAKFSGTKMPPVSSGASEPVLAESRWQVSTYVKHKTDATYLQQGDQTLNNALLKWKFLVLVDEKCSEVG